MTVRKSASSGQRKKPPARKNAREGANRRRRVVQKRVMRRAQIRDLGRSMTRRFSQAAVWLLLACAAGAGIWQGVRAYRAGRFLIVRRIEVQGNHRWKTAPILAAAGVVPGEPLFGLSSGKIRQAVLHLQGIQDVAVHVGWDGDVRMDVQEAEILAQRRAGGWQGFTTSGEWVPMQAPVADVPVAEEQSELGDADRAALAAFLDRVRSGYPDLFAGFSQIEVKNPDEADVYWRDGWLMVRMDYANKSLNSLEFLRALLRQERSAWPRQCTVDLRVEGYAYVR